MIKLDDEAYRQALALQQSDPNYRSKPLRLYIEGKGCDGFYYGVTFDEPAGNDHKVQQDALTIIIDPDSLIFCHDVTITWVDDERGRGFLVNNHNQRKYKGKFYKRQAWQKVLEEGRK